MLRKSLGARAALIGALICVGCLQAAAETKTPDEQTRVRAEAAKELSACRVALMRNKRFAPLKAKVPAFAGEAPSDRHLRDRAKPTAAMAKLVAEARSGSQPCRQKFLERLTALPAGYGGAYRTSFEKLDAVYARLERREVTFGEANKEIRDIQLEGMREAARSIGL